MAANGKEPDGSMGSDTAIAVLSNRPRLLYDYFTQLFAQVTNPPARRHPRGARDLAAVHRGSGGQRARAHGGVVPADRAAHARHRQRRPGQAALRQRGRGQPRASRAFAVDGLFEVAGGGAALRDAIEDVRAKVSAAIEDGADVIVLSDRNSSEVLAPIPSLLLVAAVHHHLVRTKSRTRVGLVVESGDAREVHHMALLKGYGAAAINPYLAFETIDDMVAPASSPGSPPDRPSATTSRPPPRGSSR